MQILKTRQKEKKTRFVSTPLLTALVKMSVFCIFHFWVFEISNCSKDVFYRLPKNQSKNNKKRRCKAKTNRKYCDSKQTREHAEKIKTNEHLETKSKQIKTKIKNQKLKWETEMHFLINPKTLELQGKQWFSQETERHKHKQTQNIHKQNKPKNNKMITTPRPIRQTHRLKKKTKRHNKNKQSKTLSTPTQKKKQTITKKTKTKKQKQNKPPQT